MSYNSNPFQNATYGIESSKKQNAPIYKGTIKRDTIYENVKVKKPIIMPVTYNPNTIKQDVKYNKTIYTNKVNKVQNADYDNLIYGNNYENNYNYNYNYDTDIYAQNSNSIDNLNYYTPTNTNTITDNINYSSSNLNYGQTTYYTDNNNYNYNYNDTKYNIISNYSNDNNYINADFNTQTTTTDTAYITDNNLLSSPYITNVVDKNKITYTPKTNVINNNVEMAKIKKIEDILTR